MSRSSAAISCRDRFVPTIKRTATYLGPNAAAEVYLLPLFEWTLPIVMLGNQPLRLRCLSTRRPPIGVQNLPLHSERIESLIRFSDDFPVTPRQDARRASR